MNIQAMAKQMNDVERYDLGFWPAGGCMEKSRDGNYVRYEDYDTLLAKSDNQADDIALLMVQKAQLQQQLAAAREALQAAEADAARYRAIRTKAVKNDSYDMYGGGAHWYIGLHTNDSRLSFDAAIDGQLPACSACKGSGEGPEVTHGYGDETRGVTTIECPKCNGVGIDYATLQRDRQP